MTGTDLIDVATHWIGELTWTLILRLFGLFASVSAYTDDFKPVAFAAFFLTLVPLIFILSWRPARNRYSTAAKFVGTGHPATFSSCTRSHPLQAASGSFSPFREARIYLLFGSTSSLLLLGSIGVWASGTEISGAVLARGTLVVDSSVKKVQHPSGGIVGEIYVKEGDPVKVGDLLVRLDDTITRANQQVVSKQLDEVIVRQTRLQAELADAQMIETTSDINLRLSEPRIARILASEQALFASRRSGRESVKAQLQQRAHQLEQEAIGLEARSRAKQREFDLSRIELAGLEQLESQSLVSTAKMTLARRTVAQLEGDCAQVIASVAQTRGKISEIQLQILQTDQDVKSEVGKELRDLQAKEAELIEKKISAEDQLRRIDIRSPQSGFVHQLSVFTVGGVISSGDPIMLIVPDQDRLVIEAHIAPSDIDQVRVGAEVQVRLSAFNQRTTPQFIATVRRISADLLVARDGDSRSSYYVARLEFDPASNQLGELKLHPGMPAEIQIKTADRSVLSYIIKPFEDQFAKAFRER